MENRAFNEMLKAAKGWLEGRDPCSIAQKTGFGFSKETSCFHFSSLNLPIKLSWPEMQFSCEISDWHKLVILHYMLHAYGYPLQEKLVSFAGLKNGMIRGGGFDRDSAAVLSRIIGNGDFACAEALLKGAGGEIIASNADVCAKLPFLPNYPVTIKIYLADDEFPAEGRMLLDASADHYLPVEDAVTVGSIILERLEEMR